MDQESPTNNKTIFSGTGIGLYLVRTLVENYGGEVRVTDNNPRGAIFTVTVPVAP